MARRDEDLPRFAGRAARNRQIGRDRLPQGPVAGRIAISHIGRTQGAQPPGRQPQPLLARKGIQRRHAQLKRRRRGVKAMHGRHAGRWRHGGLCRPAGHPRRGRQARRHHGAGLAPGQEVALAHELAVGQVHRAARHAQLAGQTARRRHPVARRQQALLDGIAKAPVYLAVQGLALATFQVRQRGTGRAFHGPVFVQIWLFQLSHGSPILAA